MPDPSVLWAKTIAAVRACQATATLAVVLLVVAGWQAVTGGDAGFVSRSFQFVSTRFLWLADPGHEMYGVADGRVWRVFTSGLVHFGVWPFVLNVAALALCGPVVERLLGRRRLVGLYAAATAAAALAVYLFDDALVQWTGAAAPVVGVATCALVLLALTGGRRRVRWVMVLLVVYCLAAWTEWYGFRTAPLIGAAIAGAAYAAIHAYLPAQLRPRATATFWAVVAAGFIVRTIVVHNSDIYTGGTYAGAADWLHLLGAVMAEVVLFGVLAALYAPPSVHIRIRRLFEHIFDRSPRLDG